MGALTSPERAALAAIALLTGLAGLARYDHWAPTAAFLLAAVALAGLAWMVSFATEELGERFGPAATGLLQSTLGNLPELFVVLFALGHGEVTVAQTALVGSIFANALLVLGAVIVVGARHSPDGVMRFNPRLPRDSATLLLLTAFIIVLVGISFGTHDPSSHHLRTISTIAAGVLLVVYMAWIVPYVRSDVGPRPGAAPRLPLATTLLLLAVAAAGSAFVSDWFVHSLEPGIRALGITRTFAGLVIVAIAGNAVEHVVGVVLAAKGRSDLAISVVKNSAVQIAAFLLPLIVIVSVAFARSLTFSLSPINTGALALTALAVWQVTGDGEAAAYEGWALIATYAILATITFYE